MTNSVPELEDADCILVTGSNTTEAHPLVANRIMRAAEKGGKLIVVDPREIQLTRLATTHLRQKPGTDVAWLNGMMNVIISEGLEDREFVESRTEGYEELKAAVASYTPERTEAITGIPAGELIAAARTYAQAERAAIVYAMGITQHTTGTDNVVSCANLSMLTGNVGKPSTGVNPLRGQNNVQGACDLGALPNVFPGYQAVTNPQVQAKFGEAWAADLPPQVGLTVVEMIDFAHEGQLKAMYIMGENPMVSDPDTNHVREALERLPFLVVQDIFLSETAELADVVLPCACYAEKTGTFTATDRRIQLVRQAVEPRGEARPDWEIICELAKRMGGAEHRGQRADGRFAGWDYSHPADIMDEMAALTPIYGGVRYERLEENGFLQWPCRSADDPGTPYLHKGQFALGKGQFTPRHYQEPAELPSAEYPFILTTGRMMFHWHTGTMTRRSQKLAKEVGEGYVEINPKDASALEIGDEEWVRLISRRGQVEARAWITRRVPAGMVFVPFHFAESGANVLTNPALDPVAKIPEYKVAAVRLERIGDPA
jgi:formate dehydrogenase alpha subunit